MIEFFRWLWSIGWSFGGLSALTSIGAIVLLLVGSRLLAILPDWTRSVLIVVAIAAGTGSVMYGKGRHDERVYYKSKINREIGKAVQRGDDARAKALEDFDSAEDVPDDGFRRDN